MVEVELVEKAERVAKPTKKENEDSFIAVAGVSMGILVGRGSAAFVKTFDNQTGWKNPALWIDLLAGLGAITFGIKSKGVTIQRLVIITVGATLLAEVPKYFPKPQDEITQAVRAVLPKMKAGI